MSFLRINVCVYSLLFCFGYADKWLNYCQLTCGQITEKHLLYLFIFSVNNFVGFFYVLCVLSVSFI